MHMKLFKTTAILLVFISMASCQKKMNSEEIYSLESSGVVLIVNDYYYSAKVNSLEIFFSGVDEDGDPTDVTTDEDEIKENCYECTGTGFFISSDGQIMTNRHVVNPKIDEDEVSKSIRKTFKELFKEEKDKLAKEWAQHEGDVNTQNEIYQDWDLYNKAYESIDEMSADDIEITTHADLYIVYNNSHVVKAEDLKPCVTVAVSEEDIIDLAIIQLKDNETPEGVYIFSLYPEEKEKELTLDQRLFMISFNAGTKIAKTKQGFRSQIYGGHVTQRSDGEQILYSIASLQGSSGSPVVDEYGYLVAVNYAKVSGTQGFNYGIPSRLIRQFLKDN